MRSLGRVRVMEFRVLGPLEARKGDWVVPIGTGMQCSLLGVLLLHANEVVSVDRLVDELWGERPPARSAKLVQGYVSGLRKLLGADRLVTRRPGYLVRVEPSELDAVEFERLVARARSEPPEGAARRLREALALWRGPALADVRLEGLAVSEAERLNELRLAALLERIDADLALGRDEELVGELETLIAEHPMRERLRGQLMLALYRAGRQAEALDVYRQTRYVLIEELGIDPSVELQSLERAILEQDPALVGQPGGAHRADLVLQLPGQIRLVPPYPFVGRSRELATLRTLVPRVGAEGRRIALVGGEAGSGKSRLVREFAHEVAAEDVLVLYGACDAVVRTPYRPFIEALDHLVRVTEVDLLRADLGPTGGELTRLLPDLALRVGELSAPITADPDTERHRLHTAVTDVLTSAARRQPLLVVVEDGHWADTPTLLLLRHLTRAATDARILVLATFRDTEADVPTELADALTELRRSDDVVRLRLRGLSESEIAEFLRSAAGATDAVPPGLARAIRDLTEGNPFLLCELWRTLAETEAFEIVGSTIRLTRPLEKIATPESVREVVRQRVSRLPPTTRDLLEVASVVGPEFALEILPRAGAEPLGAALPSAYGRSAAATYAAPELLGRAGNLAALEALEPAERSGIIEEIPSHSLAYRFTHELVRRALYDRLSGPRRAELHLRIGEALEATHRSPSARVLADLAHHFSVAAPLGGRDRAVEYNLLAAEAAAAALAFDEAAARLRTALDLGIDDERRQAEVRLELGGACVRAGESLESIQVYREAAEIARRVGDGELLARAAVGFEEACWRPGMLDRDAVGLLQEASSALPGGDSAFRVRVLAGLARALASQGDHSRGAIVRANAIEMARRIDDRQGLATVLMHAYWARGATPLGDVLEMLTESRDLAAEMGDIEIQAQAMEWRVLPLMALGDIKAAREELATVTEMAERVRQPFILYIAEQHSSAIALLEGRLRDAETAAERSREWGRLLRGRDASATYGIQMFAIRREQGRLGEIAPVARSLAVGNQGDRAWRPAFAALLAELGMEEEVERELAQVRREGLDALRQSLWLGSLIYLTDACSAIGDEELAALVYPELAPFAGTNIMIGSGVAFCGAADRYLGMLAATLGDTERANHHFAAALELDRRMGATTWLAHTCYEYGRMLQSNGESERAEPLLAEAAALADRVGMPALLARIDRPRLVRTKTGRLPHGLSMREADVLLLVARGLSNREIGAALSISKHTAANHVKNILRKTGCANRTDAASYAHQHGLVAS
jgi:DNA-binding SARP family transcriptional activator/DNA-binding CsgD family transcriptional regulator